MNSRTLLASILTICLLAIGFLSISSVADAAPAGQSFLNLSENAKSAVRTDVTEVGYRERRPHIVWPIAPSYLAYDYPYYYSRGHYPTHIGPGYIYYGRPLFYRRAYYPKYGSRCRLHRKCEDRWGHKGKDY